MGDTKPGPANHERSCQGAEQPGCECRCGGMMHQRDILVAAFESRGTKKRFDKELTRLFGSSFHTLSLDPTGDDRARRKWVLSSVASSQQAATQTEQRIVDVTLRDILQIVHGMPMSSKTKWASLLDDLTCERTWSSMSDKIHATAGPHDEASGFFWAGTLASALGAAAKARPAASPSAAAITAFPGTQSTVFTQARYPRAGSGNTVKTIKELANLSTFTLAAQSIAQALANSKLPVRQKLIVMAVVGSSISADLWRHPSAVRYLLLPAVRGLRRDTGAHFSLDSPARRVEQVISDELADKWRTHGAW